MGRHIGGGCYLTGSRWLLAKLQLILAFFLLTAR